MWIRPGGSVCLTWRSTCSLPFSFPAQVFPRNAHMLRPKQEGWEVGVNSAKTGSPNLAVLGQGSPLCILKEIHFKPVRWRTCFLCRQWTNWAWYLRGHRDIWEMGQREDRDTFRKGKVRCIKGWRTFIYFFYFIMIFIFSIIAGLQCFVNILLYSKVTQSHIYVYTLFFSHYYAPSQVTR